MSDFRKQLRRELQLAGVPATTILRVENSLTTWGGGAQHYWPKRSEQPREEVRALVGAGVPARTARWKVRGR